MSLSVQFRYSTLLEFKELDLLCRNSSLCVSEYLRFEISKYQPLRRTKSTPKLFVEVLSTEKQFSFELYRGDEPGNKFFRSRCYSVVTQRCPHRTATYFEKRTRLRCWSHNRWHLFKRQFILKRLFQQPAAERTQTKRRAENMFPLITSAQPSLSFLELSSVVDYRSNKVRFIESLSVAGLRIA